MATLGNIIADFSSTLNLKVVFGATTATIDSALDDDNVALPTGTYFFTIDTNSSNKEYIKCTLTGTSLTAIQNVSRQGVLTTGFARPHRKTANVKITDFATLRKMADLLNGTESASEITFTDLSFTNTTTAGLRVKSLTTTQRNAISNPFNGVIIFDTTLGLFMQFMNGGWNHMTSNSVQTVTTAATITPNTFDAGVDVTALSQSTTIANPAGTAINLQKILIRILDNGTGRALTFGTQYRAMGNALPTTTIAGKYMYMGFIYNAPSVKWDLIALSNQT